MSHNSRKKGVSRKVRISNLTAPYPHASTRVLKQPALQQQREQASQSFVDNVRGKSHSILIDLLLHEYAAQALGTNPYKHLVTFAAVCHRKRGVCTALKLRMIGKIWNTWSRAMMRVQRWLAGILLVHGVCEPPWSLHKTS